jgi:hypothetical protein
MQFGFRRGKSCIDATFVLTQLIEQQKKRGKGVGLAFLDIRKAYDRVWREGLWKVLEELGYGGKFLSILKALYKDNRVIANLADAQSAPVVQEVGLKQGCNLSPMLFALYIRDLSIKLQNSGHGVEYAGIRIPALFFADDMVLLGKTEDELKKLLKITGDFAVERKLEFNGKKSMVIVSWRERCENKKWEIQGEKLEEGTVYEVKIDETDEYKYLGIWIRARRGIFAQQERKMVQKAKRLAGIIKAVARTGTNNIGNLAWTKVALPAILYGTEIFNPSKRCVKQLETIQNGVGRYITRGEKWTAVSAIRGELGWDTVQTEIDRRQLGFYGRLQKKNSQSWVGKIRDGIDKETGHKIPGWSKEIRDKLNSYHLLEKVEGDDMIWKNRVKKQVKEEEGRKWQEEVNQKDSLRNYMYKENPGFANYWQWKEGSKIAFNIISGSLRTRQKLRQMGNQDEGRCVCGAEEDVEHFILKCPKRAKQREILEDITRGEEQKAESIREYVQRLIGVGIGNGKGQKIGQLLQEMWQDREREREEQKGKE